VWKYISEIGRWVWVKKRIKVVKGRRETEGRDERKGDEKGN